MESKVNQVEPINVALIRNANIPTVAFLIIGIGIAITALIVASIAFSYYNTLRNKRVEILNSIRNEDINNTEVTVNVTGDIVQFVFRLDNPAVPTLIGGSGIYTVLFKKYGDNNVTIGNYPFSNVNNVVTVSMPKFYAETIMQLIVPSGQIVNNYILSELWNISVIYRKIVV